MNKIYPKSDHYDGKHFFNQDKSVDLKTGFKNVLKWYLKDKKHPWPKVVENTFKANLNNDVKANEAAITFINHATLLVQLDQLNILTDPVFSKRVSPVSWMGPKRIREPGLKLEELPKIDVVTISHNHYDHMDLASIKKLHGLFEPLFIVPLANAKFLHKIGIKKVIELDWWENCLVKDCLITLVPAQHWSGRTLRDRYQSLWGGFVYSCQDIKIYFAGDTGYNNHFKEIYQRFGAMDISLLPIGAYEPRWFMQAQHINPEEAVLAHIELNSKVSIGMHFGTFALANEGLEHPVQDLNISLEKYQLTEKDFLVLDHGETLKYAKEELLAAS
jgi:L-ascorbate metabolism protein UlaG (beta-lactamase superfamily)